jgi:8-oxo-dGTP pyrophosphatase MutT (NUDIX family)
MKVDFLEIGKVEDKELEFAVICASFQGKWIYVKHKQRDTWEIPGGRREIGEDITVTANRELYEETGAIEFTVEPVCDYFVIKNEEKSYGRLFYAIVTKLGELPNSEIGEVKLFDDLPKEMTYPEIQPILFERILKEAKAMNVDRLNIILEMLFQEMNGLTDEDRDLPILWNVMHMYSSLQIAKLLAMRRGINFELAAITAALHDIAVIKTKKTKNHAENAEKYIREVITSFNESNKGKMIFINQEEEDMIIRAVINHSNKGEYSNDSFIELLKDVDSLDRYLHGVKTDGEYLVRCKKTLRELGIAEFMI